jgi:hypothetical protein
MALSYLTIADIFFAFLALFVFIKILRRSSVPHALLLPPGPKGLPIVGNILDMPSEKEWLTFAQWGERWGESIKLPYELHRLTFFFKVIYVLLLCWASLSLFSTLRKLLPRCLRRRIPSIPTVQLYRWEGSSLVGRILLFCYPMVTAFGASVVCSTEQSETPRQ